MMDRRALLVMGMLVLLVWTAEGVPGRRRKPRVQCPIPKICGWGCNPERRSIDCSYSMLGPYSPDLPDVHTEFNWEADFSSNSILTIQNMAFYGTFEDIIPFSSLDYSYNLIHTIEPQAFQGLELSLHSLILDVNNLEFIPAVALQNLTKLHHLSVSGNKLYNIDFVCSTALPQLHTLDVSYNRISGISPTCFYGTRLGKTENSALSLQGNRIETMDACTLQGRQFDVLNYANNSLMCMCEISWLSSPDFVSSTEVECRQDDGNTSLPLNEYTSAHCEPLSVNSIECEEFAINATYREGFDNHSEVQVNWFSKDFPDIAHIHATLYYFKNGTSSEVGRYKLQKTKPEGYTIQLPDDSGQDLLVCLATLNRTKTQSQQPALLTDTNSAAQAANGTVTNPQQAPANHRQCQTVTIPEIPEPIIGQLRSFGQSTTGYTFMLWLIITYSVLCTILR